MGQKCSSCEKEIHFFTLSHFYKFNFGTTVSQGHATGQLLSDIRVMMNFEVPTYLQIIYYSIVSHHHHHQQLTSIFPCLHRSDEYKLCYTVNHYMWAKIIIII